MVDAISIIRAPKIIVIGIRYLWSSPTINLAQCGATSPTKATVPINPTAPAIRNAQIINTIILKFATSIPKLLALSSPAVSAVNFQVKRLKKILPIIRIAPPTQTLTQEARDKFPKDQFWIICATSAEALYWRYCCKARKKKFIIIPVRINVLVSNPLAFPIVKIAIDTPNAKIKARVAVPIHWIPAIVKFKEAIDVAKNSEVAVVFAGLPDSFESEGYDRKDMKLPLCQNELINKILEVQKNTVVVLYNGSSIELPWADDVNGVLEMYLAGEATGEATVDLLYGEANPCGRLPESFPYKLEDNPSYLFFHGDGKKVEYKEGVYVGYRYYDKKKMGVRYPFGYGLSYTTFEYSNLRIDKTDMEDKDIITVKVDITNTGKLAGKEVVQLYVKDNTGTIGRPEKELKGFDKIALSPGEVGTVEFKISKESLVYYNTEINDWYAASGNYEILICRSYKEIELRESINFRTTKKIPFVIDENTTVGELLNDPRTKQVVEGQIQQFLSSGGNSDIAKAAISDEMIMHTMIYSPLRSLRTFANLDDNAINAMIAYLNFLTQ